MEIEFILFAIGCLCVMGTRMIADNDFGRALDQKNSFFYCFGFAIISKPLLLISATYFPLFDVCSRFLIRTQYLDQFSYQSIDS